MPPAISNIILMAEDDSDDRLLVKDAMAECQWEADLRFVENGEELIGCLRHCAINPVGDGLVLSKNREGKRQCGFY